MKKPLFKKIILGKIIFGTFLTALSILAFATAKAQLLLPLITIDPADIIQTSPTTADFTATTSNFGSPIQVKVEIWEGGAISASAHTFSPAFSAPANSSFVHTLDNLLPGTTYSFRIVDATNTSLVYSQNTLTFDMQNNVVGVNTSQPTPTCTSGPDGYCLLAPLGGVSVIHDTELADYFGMIYKILIGLAGVLAVIMIFFGGVQYMTTDALFEKQLGRERIKNAVLGLIIALGSYAILNTINPNLLNFSFGITPVTIQYDPDLIDRHEPQTPVGGNYCIYQAGGGYPAGTAWGDDTAERTSLMNISVSVKIPSCATVGQMGCTSVKQLQTSGVAKLRTKCPTCEIVITGGTECWAHSPKTAHGKGSATVDLRNNGSVPNLKAYIEAPNNYKGNMPGWGRLYVVDGMEFIHEGDHYHVWGWNGEHASQYPQ